MTKKPHGAYADIDLHTELRRYGEKDAEGNLLSLTLSLSEIEDDTARHAVYNHTLEALDLWIADPDPHAIDIHIPPADIARIDPILQAKGIVDTTPSTFPVYGHQTPQPPSGAASTDDDDFPGKKNKQWRTSPDIKPDGNRNRR